MRVQSIIQVNSLTPLAKFSAIFHFCRHWLQKASKFFFDSQEEEFHKSEKGGSPQNCKVAECTTRLWGKQDPGAAPGRLELCSCDTWSECVAYTASILAPWIVLLFRRVLRGSCSCYRIYASSPGSHQPDDFALWKSSCFKPPPQFVYWYSDFVLLSQGEAFRSGQYLDHAYWYIWHWRIAKPAIPHSSKGHTNCAISIVHIMIPIEDFRDTVPNLCRNFKAGRRESQRLEKVLTCPLSKILWGIANHVLEQY